MWNTLASDMQVWPHEYLLPPKRSWLSSRYWRPPPAQEKPWSHHLQLKSHFVARSHLSPAIKTKATALLGSSPPLHFTWRHCTESRRVGKPTHTEQTSGGDFSSAVLKGWSIPHAKGHPQLTHCSTPTHAILNWDWKRRMTSRANPPHGGGFLPAALSMCDSERRKIFIQELFWWALLVFALTHRPKHWRFSPTPPGWKSCSRNLQKSA